MTDEELVRTRKPEEWLWGNPFVNVVWGWEYSTPQKRACCLPYRLFESLTGGIMVNGDSCIYPTEGAAMAALADAARRCKETESR